MTQSSSNETETKIYTNLHEDRRIDYSIDKVIKQLKCYWPPPLPSPLSPPLFSPI